MVLRGNGDRGEYGLVERGADVAGAMRKKHEVDGWAFFCNTYSLLYFFFERASFLFVVRGPKAGAGGLG